eukprot:m.6844 g.6844  ORF g.6844 m.6844 type:complete len:66 (-) comp2661_c0_seq1:46-243(-)
MCTHCKSFDVLVSVDSLKQSISKNTSNTCCATKLSDDLCAGSYFDNLDLVDKSNKKKETWSWHWF